jgi:hypothetical protein
LEVDAILWNRVASVGAISKSTTTSPTPNTKLSNGMKAMPVVYYIDVARFVSFKVGLEVVNAVLKFNGNSMPTLIDVKLGIYRYINYYPIVLPIFLYINFFLITFCFF